MRTLTRLTLLLAVMVSCVGCDQVTKGIASRDLRGRPPVRLLGNTVQLVYAENGGGFLSLGEHLPRPVRSTVFVTFTIVAIGGLLTFAIIGRSPTLLQLLGTALFAAGGLGNLIDRITRGSARDFIVVQAGPLRTGVFNIADMAIMAGIVALLIAHGGRSTTSAERAD
jgi:signal peptidase II